MSKRVIIALLVVISFASTAFAISNPDGLYIPKAAVAEVASEVAPTLVVETSNHPSNLHAREGVTHQINKGQNLLEALAGFTTNFNVNANANNEEDQAVNAANVSASVSASKGPLNLTYTHSRSYYRYVDGYTGYVDPSFQGSVNNQVTIGFTIQPDFSDDDYVDVSAISVGDEPN